MPGYQFFIALHNNGFHHVGLVVQLVFDLLGIDILAACPNNQALAATLDKHIIVLIHKPKITGTQPSVFGEGSCRCLDVITYHNVVSPGLDFSYNGTWILRINSERHPLYGFSARNL